MEILKVDCNNCKNETKHNVVHHQLKLIEAPDQTKPEEKHFYLIECAGCESISFYSKNIFISEDLKEITLIDQYPEYFSETNIYEFLSDKEKEELPDSLFELYEEVSSAFKKGSQILAGIGLRVLVEATCLHQEISGTNLKVKIENLREQGLISKNEHPIIDKLREIGNASAHQIKSLSLDKLGYALQIVNHMLKSIYVLPKINKKLKI